MCSVSASSSSSSSSSTLNQMGLRTHIRYTQYNSSHEIGKHSTPYLSKPETLHQNCRRFLMTFIFITYGVFSSTYANSGANTTAFLWRVYYVSVHSTIHGRSNKHFFRRWWIVWFWTRRRCVDRLAIWVHHSWAAFIAMQCTQSTKRFVYFSFCACEHIV